MIKIIRENQNPQTQTPEFKRWFGNSKVVDDRGNPLVVYHGTDKEFDTFLYSNIKEESGDYVGEGFYFTRQRHTALKYGNTIKECYLKIENPVLITSKTDIDNYNLLIYKSFTIEEVSRITKQSISEIKEYIDLVGMYYVQYILIKTRPGIIKEKLIELGYDGLIDSLYGQYATFYPNQIKSATDNNGDFDPRSNNIYEKILQENKESNLMKIRDYYDGLGMDVDIFTSTYANKATLSRLYVPKDLRGRGYAKEAMNALTDWADRYGITLLLTPTNEWGASKARLIQFYKEFGFVENKGSNKDYRYMETMYRKPKTD